MAGQNFIGVLELWNAHSQRKQMNKGTRKWCNLPSSEEENLGFEFAASSVPWTKNKWVWKAEIAWSCVWCKWVLHKENNGCLSLFWVLLLQGWVLFGKLGRHFRVLEKWYSSRFEVDIFNSTSIKHETILPSHRLNISEIFIVYKDFLKSPKPKIFSVPVLWLNTNTKTCRTVEFFCLRGTMSTETAEAWSSVVAVAAMALGHRGCVCPLAPCDVFLYNGKVAPGRAWGVRSGVRYLRPFSHSSPVWVILYCVKKRRRKIEED